MLEAWLEGVYVGNMSLRLWKGIPSGKKVPLRQRRRGAAGSHRVASMA